METYFNMNFNRKNLINCKFLKRSFNFTYLLQNNNVYNNITLLYKSKRKLHKKSNRKLNKTLHISLQQNSKLCHSQSLQ